MTLKEWQTDYEFYFHKPKTLGFLLLSLGLLLVTVIIPFVNNYTTNPIIHISVFLIFNITVIGYWIYIRTVFPKNKDNKEHIILAIITENAKQKTRITNDFANQIKKRLTELNLNTTYALTILSNYQSTLIQKKIEQYIQSNGSNYDDSNKIIEFKKIIKRLNAKFIVYGNLIERNPDNSTYSLSLDALILHRVTDYQSGQTLHNEFQKLWKNEIDFLEKEELTGFKANAEHIFFTASYMLGLATFVDNSYLHGINIWEGLEKHIEKKEELKEYLENVKRLKSASYLLYSRFLYFNNKIEESMIFRKKYLDLFPNEYDRYLTEAINQIKISNDPQLALDFVDRARNIAPANDGTWRYSKFYLLIRLSHCHEALLLLDEIIKHNFPNEIDTINQVFHYNLTCIIENPNHIQTNFIIGALIYKKLNNPIEAYEKLELFIKDGKNRSGFEPLLDKAKEYLIEINNIIEVKN